MKIWFARQGWNHTGHISRFGVPFFTFRCEHEKSCNRRLPRIREKQLMHLRNLVLLTVDLWVLSSFSTSMTDESICKPGRGILALTGPGIALLDLWFCDMLDVRDDYMYTSGSLRPETAKPKNPRILIAKAPNSQNRSPAPRRRRPRRRRHAETGGQRSPESPDIVWHVASKCLGLPIWGFGLQVQQ